MVNTILNLIRKCSINLKQIKYESTVKHYFPSAHKFRVLGFKMFKTKCWFLKQKKKLLSEYYIFGSFSNKKFEVKRGVRTLQSSNLSKTVL